MNHLHRFRAGFGALVIGVASALALAPGIASAAQSMTISPTTINSGASGTMTLTATIDTTGAMGVLKVDPGACFMLTGESDAKLSLHSGLGGNSAVLDGVWWFDVSPNQAVSTTVAYTLNYTADTTLGTCLLNATYYSPSTTSLGSPTSVSITVAAAPTPTPTPTATPTPTPTPTAGTAPSTALTQFMQIFYTVCIGFAALIVPFFVLTWVIRLVADMVKGKS